MTAADYDVAIIGYGPTGVTAANLLGARGLRVLAVDRDADIYSRARAISTDEEVVRIWQRIGLAEPLKQDMLSERPIDYVDAAGRSFLSMRPRSLGNWHPPQMSIYQPALEQVLRDGVNRYPNVEVRLQHEALRISQDAEGVDLILFDVPANAVRSVRARSVIAADGGSSATRALLGVGFEGRTYEDRWVVIDTEACASGRPMTTSGSTAIRSVPPSTAPPRSATTAGSSRSFPATTPRSSSLTTPCGGLLARHGITFEQVKILRAVVYSHHVRFAARWRIGRVFLAGDAAHVMPPWIGQAMAAGVRDAGNLCWKVDAVIRGELPDTVLDSYETERQPHVRAVTKAAVFFGRVITERRRPVARLRNGLFCVLSRTPYIGDYLRSGRWFPAARYADGFFADREDAPAVGFLIPSRSSSPPTANGSVSTTSPAPSGASSTPSAPTMRSRRRRDCPRSGSRQPTDHPVPAVSSTSTVSLSSGCATSGRPRSCCAPTGSSTMPPEPATR